MNRLLMVLTGHSGNSHFKENATGKLGRWDCVVYWPIVLFARDASLMNNDNKGNIFELGHYS